MGKASTAKKVARAQRAGGKKSSKQRQLGFPVAIISIIILGLATVTWARASGQLGSDADNPPRVEDHWHAAYGIYICDRFIQNLGDVGPDTLGIHTHDDGLVHIHPFSTGAAGKQAKFKRFFDQVDLSISDSKIGLPSAQPFDGRTYKEGETTCGGEPAIVEVTYWSSAIEAAEGAEPERTYTEDFGSIRFLEDMGAYTIAFVPADTKVPPPPGAQDILTNAQNDQAPQPDTGVTEDTAPLDTAPLETTPADDSTPADAGTDTSAPVTAEP